MKFNLNNPAFLQMAGNVGGEKTVTRFVFVEGQNQVQLSANGSAVIESVQDGEIVRETYSALNDTAVTINADSDTEVVIYGAVTKFSIYPTFPHDVIKSLDVSKNTALTYLGLGGCKSLASLDVSENTVLNFLNLGDCTSLTSLDVSKNNALTYLNLGMSLGEYSGLTSLDVSKNTALTKLYCYNCTGLTSLDVSKNTALTKLHCYGCTGLTSLDVNKNTALTDLYCSNCPGLTSLDVSKNTALTELHTNSCTGLMLLDIQNTAQIIDGDLFNGISTNLTTLQVAGTSAWAYEKVKNWLNGDAPSGGTILVDENTPEYVTTAATTKGWSVEYVDA